MKSHDRIEIFLKHLDLLEEDQVRTKMKMSWKLRKRNLIPSIALCCQLKIDILLLLFTEL
ncbi:uncharacterized protein DS421_13g438800 [Arachis hypogaea]|nr:uncharacterized protein DS421_13g438800 [Arachis hypogaea]